MRCMTKAISMHGLGLYIYAGEDLPEGEEKPPSPIPESFRSSATMGVLDALPQEEQHYLRELAEEIKVDVIAGSAMAAVDRIERENLDNEQKIGLWSILDSKTRSAIKKAQAAMREPATTA
jgi:hypothetical protein